MPYEPLTHTPECIHVSLTGIEREAEVLAKGIAHQLSVLRRIKGVTGGASEEDSDDAAGVKDVPTEQEDEDNECSSQEEGVSDDEVRTLNTTPQPSCSHRVHLQSLQRAPWCAHSPVPDDSHTFFPL
jgi:hypothetical protein